MKLKDDIAFFGIWAYLIANNALLLSMTGEGAIMGYIATICAGIFFPIWIGLSINEIRKKKV